MKRPMACGNVSDLIRNEKVPCSSEILESFWMPESSSSDLQVGGKSMMNFENFNGAAGGGDTAGTSFFGIQSLDKEEINGGYDDFDVCLSNPAAGKKRRLTASQVQFLEKNFEVENKLEPDRKNQLAKQIGLEPRQVAVWFQNRRARFKNQRLEKDYGSLKSDYDKLKADYDCLLKEKELLQNQVVLLKQKLPIREKERGIPENFDSAITKSLEPETLKPESKADIKNMLNLPTMAACKQEDASSASAKSEIFDSDSPLYTDGNHSSSFLEPEISDFSQDEEDNIVNNNNYNNNNASNGLFPLPYVLKLEEDCCFDDPPINSCNLGSFSIEEDDDQIQQPPFWSWPY